MLQGIRLHAREYSSPVGVAVTVSDRSNAGDGVVIMIMHRVGLAHNCVF